MELFTLHSFRIGRTNEAKARSRAFNSDCHILQFVENVTAFNIHHQAWNINVHPAHIYSCETPGAEKYSGMLMNETLHAPLPMILNIAMDNTVERHVKALALNGDKEWEPGARKFQE